MSTAYLTQTGIGDKPYSTTHIFIKNISRNSSETLGLSK